MEAEQTPEYPPAPQHMHAGGYGTPKSSKKRWWIIAVIVLVLAAGAGVAGIMLRKKDTSTPVNQAASSQSTASTNQNKSTGQTAQNEADASALKTYKSTKLGLEFSYRSDWTMRETADKTEIILSSPRVIYQKKDGTTTQGPFTLKLRNGIVPDKMKPSIENAVAIKDSEVIAYSAPTEQQRKYTNLSFAGNGSNMQFFLVSGSVAFKAGEAFGSNIDLQGSVYVFAGGYGADTGDTLGFDAVSKGSFDTAVYRQAVAVVASLKIY